MEVIFLRLSLTSLEAIPNVSASKVSMVEKMNFLRKLKMLLSKDLTLELEEK